MSSRREGDRPGDKDLDLAESEDWPPDSSLDLMGSWVGSLMVIDRGVEVLRH